MPTLRVTVEWIDGKYHGVEWPPSPLRLYQAMIAGYAVHRRGDPVLESAMRHLETLPPPTIFAPQPEEWSPIASAVPNNDGDRVLLLHQKGDRLGARKKESKARTIRVRQPRTFAAPVIYDWEASVETVQHLAALEAIAACVSAVGQGTDVAIARAEFMAESRPATGIKYTPSLETSHRLNIPYAGVFDVLEDRYRKFRSRIAPHGIAKVPEPAHRQAGYFSELNLPRIRCEAFRVLDMKGASLSFDGTQAMKVAAMVRHAIGIAARRAGLKDSTVSELMGHGGTSRIRIHPLPNVGYSHADGRIRRVMLTIPQSVEKQNWLDVISRLTGATLIPLGQHGSIGTLAAIAKTRDPILSRYCAKAKLWTTATPVVLPGHDHRRGRSRPDRSVRRLLRHAGISNVLVRQIKMESAAQVQGAFSPVRYFRPRHLKKFPIQHMSIEWNRPVVGPLALGAGIGYGLGLFVPKPMPGRARTPSSLTSPDSIGS